MIENHLDQLRATLEQATGLPENTRAELLKLVAAMRNETTHQAADGAEPGAEMAGPGITGLMASVEKLEVSHPEIAALINQVAITLSRMGI
jgi:hypothetical protein